MSIGIKACLASVATSMMCVAPATSAADWSDTSISVRAGKDFREPFNSARIGKIIYSLTHASAYKYGSNFFNLDYLQSDSNDPAALGSDEGAREAYVVYRHTIDLGKLSGKELSVGAVRGLGATLGFDWNRKTDVAYNSRKRMLVIGPTLMWDVPGFLNTSVLLLKESNAPSGAFPPISTVGRRYSYDVHPMLSATWGLPIADGVSFEGYANVIANKGKSEVGNKTGPETNIDMQVMFELGGLIGAHANTLRAGFAYQYWNNKFGNTAATTGGRGQRAATPMLRVAYHF